MFLKKQDLCRNDIILYIFSTIFLKLEDIFSYSKISCLKFIKKEITR